MDAELFDHVVAPSAQPGLTLENQHCVRYTVDGRLLARQGTMVAHRGDLAIRTRSQGVKKLLKRAVTGEGLALMEVEGHGEIWFADLAKNVFVLDGEGFSVTGKCVLCFDASLGYHIRRITGGGMSTGLFTCTFAGTGKLAIAAHGEPMVFPVGTDSPVLVDTDAVLGWTTSLQTSIHRAEGLKSVLKGGSGELFHVRFEGEGIVLVQPSEGPIVPKGKGVADAIGEFL